MKRIAAFLVVAALSLSLCACQSGVDPKYQAVIDQLENGNYQNAIDLIEGMAQTDKDEHSGNTSDENKEEEDDTASGLTPEQSAWMEKVVGTWLPDKYATEAGHTGVAVKQDGTCTVDGKAYTWKMGNASTTNAWLEVWDGQNKLYGLQISINADYGYMRASLFQYTGEHNSASTEGAYYCAEEYDVIEITSDNWQEYFELKEVVATNKNAFGEVDRFFSVTYFRLKDSYGTVNAALSFGGTEYQYVSTCQDVTVDLTNMTYTPVGDVRNTSDSNSTSEWHQTTDSNNALYYGITVGSFVVHDVNKSLTDTTWRPTNVQILRAQGTVYAVKK